jgi:cyclopropane-fatty-acyl-phospholipid synthase
MSVIQWAEKGWVPDSLIRLGIRRLCQERLRDESKLLQENGEAFRAERFASLRASPIAVETRAANEQHYEVPTEFYKLVLGRHLKYSACWWDHQALTLDDAESAMLRIYAERAQLQDGQRVLDLGCGWGSVSLWLAERYPAMSITAVSNSATQRQYIESCAAQRGLRNLQVITCDVNKLQFSESFDRIISIEMLEHVRNYDALFGRIRSWLKDDGLMFIHIFCHRDLVYPFETEGDKNWMGRYFFTGGLMPSVDTFSKVQNHLKIAQQWDVNGSHYARTAEAWLDNLDRNRAQVKAVFEPAYGAEEAEKWIQRWRMFFMACAELFGYREGNEWLVCHYLMRK